MKKNIPLAEYLRPETLNDYVGQEHLIGEGAMLRNLINQGKIPSIIFWGPPGVGKTTLANIIAKSLQKPFFSLSAINSGVKEVREIIEKASEELKLYNQTPVLFIDEIHRFSKSQQDSLLGAVEKGIVTLIGATTENPSFEVISPLLSRTQLYVLKPLEPEHLINLLQKAVNSDFFTGKNIEFAEYEALLSVSGGDARKLLGALEVVIESSLKDDIIIDNKLVTDCLQKNLLIYDKKGEAHYDTISAFIKSMRGSDPNATVYWLARMIEAGEDLLFIARRMLILASEDIGNANPTALVLAQACYQSVHNIGYPEGRIILSQTAIYLASSPKSNASYMAIEDALDLVRKHGNLPVPLSLRNAPTKMMKDLDYGKNYQYAHSFAGNFVNLEFLPDKLSGTKLYNPGNNPREAELRTYLKKCWNDKYLY